MANYLTERRGEKFPGETHLVGDKAYPCLPTLMVPFRDDGHLTQNQRHFNYKLSAVRSVIERSFALLKKRFRRLIYLDVKDIEWACKYILACCILHNICILQEDVLQIEEVENEDENEDFVREEFDRQFHRLGVQKRNYLCEMLH